MASLLASKPQHVGKLAFVLSSSQREKVLGAIVPAAKTPAQIAKETGLRLPHVSRALGQLAKEGLVGNLNGSTRGRLYGPTEMGRTVFEDLSATRGDRVVAPLARGTHYQGFLHWLTQNHGRKAAEDFLRSQGIDPGEIDADNWYPLGRMIAVMEAIDIAFGDGTGELSRRMLQDEVGNFPSVRRLLARVIPLRYMLEMAPNAYNREFNHGRVEVEVRGRSALMRNYDWISTPIRCMAWQGTYEGGLRVLGVKGTVTKVACILKGDPYCGYLLEW